jgi:hypothetical protein
MLPGFRFLLAAIVLSTSMLVFGLGAAALLRAAHEQFASNPSWHTAPEATFAQQAEAVIPVLAMLHAEPTPAEPAPAVPARAEAKAPDNVSEPNALAIPPPAEQAANIASVEPTATSPATPEPVSVAPAASEPDRLAALKPEQTSTPEPAKSAIADDATPSLPTPVQSETPAAEPTASVTPALASESTSAPVQQAAIAVTLPASESVPAAAEARTAGSPESSPADSPELDAISAKMAALDSRPLILQPKPRPTAAIARSEQAAIKKRARQAALRRKMAAQAGQVQMAPALPFPPYPQAFNQPSAFNQPPAAKRNH